MSLVSCGKALFLTTPIFYINAAPHIGHLYSVLLADAYGRWHMLKNPESGGGHMKMSVGTDEHGAKVFEASSLNRIDCAKYCDTISGRYKSLFKECGIGFTDFIRTTQSRHKKSVEHFWNCLKVQDMIYKGSYSGWYCTSDETFYSEKELTKEGNSAFKSPTGHPVFWISEENYMFRLSAFGEQLKAWIADRKPIYPSYMEKDVLHTIDSQCSKDLSVSRLSANLAWGVDVPGDPNHKVYVWLDALANYLTAAGYPDRMEPWPPDVQVVGKDILKFHAVYWPAFLMAAGLPLPKAIFCHSHWTVQHAKMSKSRGNVVDPIDLIRKFGVDGLRYFLLRQGVAHRDGNYEENAVVNVLNSELANVLGNLASRAVCPTMNPLFVWPPLFVKSLQDDCHGNGERLLQMLKDLPFVVEKHFESMDFCHGVDAIIAVLQLANSFYQHNEPWKLVKSIKRPITCKSSTAEVANGSTLPKLHHRLDTINHVVYETLRVTSLLLLPIVPDLGGRILTLLSIEVSERTLGYASMPASSIPDLVGRKLHMGERVVFKRIDAVQS